mmetsp:Transcript_14252/g.36929  ORF Transcript_14252/g.36929 Transcript_14252/m.36929 type:complete len:307 (-) Transcript_14252:123-1043(-)
MRPSTGQQALIACIRLRSSLKIQAGKRRFIRSSVTAKIDRGAHICLEAVELGRGSATPVRTGRHGLHLVRLVLLARLPLRFWPREPLADRCELRQRIQEDAAAAAQHVQGDHTTHHVDHNLHVDSYALNERTRNKSDKTRRDRDRRQRIPEKHQIEEADVLCCNTVAYPGAVVVEVKEAAVARGAVVRQRRSPQRAVPAPPECHFRAIGKEALADRLLLCCNWRLRGVALFLWFLLWCGRLLVGDGLARHRVQLHRAWVENIHQHEKRGGDRRKKQLQNAKDAQNQRHRWAILIELVPSEREDCHL